MNAYDQLAVDMEGMSLDEMQQFMDKRLNGNTDKDIEIPGQKFITKDSGKRFEFETGAQRNDRVGKGRYDLIPVAALRRWAQLLERGSVVYGERNFEKGMPFSLYLDSAMRHLLQFLEGESTEDHLAAVLFNVGAIMHHQQAIEEGKLNASLDDRPCAENK